MGGGASPSGKKATNGRMAEEKEVLAVLALMEELIFGPASVKI